jgi:hypothetical protein
MIVSVSVPLALALSLALAFTPAVVGACAALVCAPVGGSAAVVADQGHGGHHETPAASSDVSDEHAHHASMHGAGHAETAVVEPDSTADARLRLRLRGSPAHECCATAAASAVAATPGANRLDTAAHVDAVATAFGTLAGVAGSGLRRPPTRANNVSVPPSSAPLVLRV